MLPLTSPPPATEFAHVQERFLARARADTQEVIEHCQSLLQASPSSRRETLRTICALLHRLAGTGGSLGFRAYGDLARLLERVCLTMIRYPEDEFSACLQELSDGAAELSRLLDSGIPADANLATIEPERPGTGRDSSLICVVSHDQVLVQALRGALEGLGHDVLDFASLAELEQRARELDVSAFVVQLHDAGEELAGLARLRATRSAPAPVVAIGAGSGFDQYLACVRAAADGYFPLPLNLPRLEGCLRHLIERGRSEPYRVLLVDDDPDFLVACASMLRDAGMQVLSIDDPTTALGKLAEFRPEVILVDIQMPQCTGPELAQVVRMHADWAHVPIVYVSSASDGADQLLATRKAGEDFVSKPIDPRKLVATVRANGRHARQVSDTVSRDSLTGVLKRGFINEYLTFELERAARLDTCTSIAMIDIDLFKSVNDQHGHPAGDLVIRTLASVLRQQLRASDGIGRVGGEEFLAVLPNCSVAEARAIMESALHRFSEIRFSSPAGEFSCTFSAGIAETAGDGLSETQLIGQADRALYEAKRAGRNQVHAAAARAKRARH